MQKFSNKQKVAGEIAVRGLSDKAFEFYSDITPIDVYEYDKDGMKLYAYSGVFGDRDGMTFDELEQDFEEMADEMEG